MGDYISYNLCSSHLTPTGHYTALSYKVQNTSKMLYFCQGAEQTEQNSSLIYTFRKLFQITQNEMLLNNQKSKLLYIRSNSKKLNSFFSNKTELFTMESFSFVKIALLGEKA